MEICEALFLARGILRNQLEAEILLAHAAGISREKIFAHPEILLSKKAQKRFLDDFAARRSKGEPIAYITGHKEFFGLDFYVDKRVLIPRPETELLVDVILSCACHELGEWSKDDGENKSLKICDTGTGSGCIAVALAKNLRNAQIVALDNSTDALLVAKRNAKNHKVNNKIKFIKSDLLVKVLNEKFDVIVANLPYIGDSEKHEVDKEVLDYEPCGALFSGKSGLELYDKLFGQIKSMKNKPYCLVAEIGAGQKQKITALIKKYFGNKPVMWKNDLARIPRIFVLFI